MPLRINVAFAAEALSGRSPVQGRRECASLPLKVADIVSNFLGLPFDVARAQYARAVEAGLLERSMLASRNVHRTISALENLTLGPWARHR